MDILREINSSDEQGGSRDGLFIRIIVLHIIVANAVEWDDRWFVLADMLEGLDLLQHYLAHGDSVLLANLINITRG